MAIETRRRDALRDPAVHFSLIVMQIIIGRTLTHARKRAPGL